MATNIGLNVIEVDGSAAAPIQGAAVSVGAFNVLTRRGVPNQPTRVTSFAEFSDRFGSFDSGGFGAYLVKGFFDNGGQRAYVNRVAGSGGNAPATASATITQGAAASAPGAARARGRLPRSARPRDVGQRHAGDPHPLVRLGGEERRRRREGRDDAASVSPGSPSATRCSSRTARTARS